MVGKGFEEIVLIVVNSMGWNMRSVLWIYRTQSRLTNYVQHNFSHHDCQAYYLRIADEWKPIDYSKDPDTWMTPLKQGQATGLVEIPASWYLDDLPPMVREHS